MSDALPITTLDQARAALDQEIAAAESAANYAERIAAESTAKLDGARSKAYTLRVLRDRMDVPE